MDTNSPAAHFCNSMCIKLDETEQKVLALVLAHSTARMMLTFHVATAGISIKTSTMGCPSMWNTAPQRIERTTINCLWKFLQRACPFGPWGIVPTAAACVWLVFVSNKRLIGWLSWHGKGSKTLLRQDEKEEEEAQQPSPMSPEVIIMSINKCYGNEARAGVE